MVTKSTFNLRLLLLTLITLGSFLQVQVSHAFYNNNQQQQFHYSNPNFNHLQHGVANKPQPLICTHDSLIFYQDCRLCLCPRPNRHAKCYKKSCDLRTKDGGQCPVTSMKIDDSHLCPVTPTAQCKVDTDCPGNQLCCFDFCNGAKCTLPVPLDVTSGFPRHYGRGYP